MSSNSKADFRLKKIMSCRGFSPWNEIFKLKFLGEAVVGLVSVKISGCGPSFDGKALADSLPGLWRRKLLGVD